MMKRLLVGAMVMLVSCSNDDTNGDNENGGSVLNLRYSVVEGGGAVKLSWDLLMDVDTYYIYVDDVMIASVVRDTEFIITENKAGRMVEVKGGQESEFVDFGASVVKSDFTLGEYDTGVPFAMGFDSECNVNIYDNNPAYYAYYDLYISDGSLYQVHYDGIDLCSPSAPHGVPTSFNDKKRFISSWGNGCVAPSVTDYYANIYPGTGGVIPGKSYALWIDGELEAEAWDTTDHFVKIYVETVSLNGMVCGFVYYQKIGGLRWVPADR